MIKLNEKKILHTLKKDDKVLDIGGWDKPFNRANYVLDIQPYKTRGFHGSQGGKQEFFTEKTWIIHDISSRKKLPFKDNFFDFVICSHVLEDIRDPLWLCSEIKRISKRGYIEFPSIFAELTKGIDNNKYVGYYHHRWLIELKKNKLYFRFKPHFIHNDKRYHFPKTYLKRITEEKINTFLFWDDEFEFSEIIQISRDKTKRYLNRIILKEGYRKKATLFLNFIDKIKYNYKYIKKKLNKNTYCPRYMDVEEYHSTA
ncbi:MAG: methyltransferase domain-containing protein [Candidatus Pacearchaeota archaeon]